MLYYEASSKPNGYQVQSSHHKRQLHGWFIIHWLGDCIYICQGYDSLGVISVWKTEFNYEFFSIYIFRFLIQGKASEGLNVRSSVVQLWNKHLSPIYEDSNCISWVLTAIKAHLFPCTSNFWMVSIWGGKIVTPMVGFCSTPFHGLKSKHPSPHNRVWNFSLETHSISGAPHNQNLFVEKNRGILLQGALCTSGKGDTCHSWAKSHNSRETKARLPFPSCLLQCAILWALRIITKGFQRRVSRSCGKAVMTHYVRTIKAFLFCFVLLSFVNEVKGR